MRPGEAVAALAAEWKLTASLSQGGPGSRASFQQLGQAPPGAALLPATHLLIHGKTPFFGSPLRLFRPPSDVVGASLKKGFPTKILFFPFRDFKDFSNRQFFCQMD